MTSCMRVFVSPLYVVMFGNAATAFKTYLIRFEIQTVPLSDDFPSEYRVFEWAGECGALMDTTVPALPPPL